MNYPPMAMRMKIFQPGRRINLWLPLFIIVPVVLVIASALFLVLLPFVLVASFVFGRFGLLRKFFFFWPVVGCLAAARGLEVDIKKRDGQVLVAFK